ncbi:MAG: hypothetical protein WC979_05410 [Candidatus Pacearchaeota archaeon]|jgi:hypothetical protein
MEQQTDDDINFEEMKKDLMEIKAFIIETVNQKNNSIPKNKGENNVLATAR